MPDTILLVEMFLLLLAIGAVSGVIAGLLGVGGGIVLVPAFFFSFEALGYGGPHLMQICLATSLATIIFTSIRSVTAHNRKGAVDWKILRDWAPGIVIGAIVGVFAVGQLKSEALQVIFGSIGLIIAAYMAFGSTQWRLGSEMPGLVWRSVFSPIVGFLSVLMGIGGGSFGVPLMTLYGVAIHRAVATASGFGVSIALPSVLGFLISPVVDAPPLTVGSVNVPAFLVVVAVSMVTTPLGVRIAHAMNPAPLKRVFAVFLAAVAINMLWKALA